MFFSNEAIFIYSLIFIAFFLYSAARLGKEALIGFISVQWVLANILVTTQITIMGVTATAAEPLAVGALLGFSLLQEYYGSAAARISIWTGFLSLLFMSGITTLYRYYTPSPEDLFYTHTVIVFASTLRITLASAISYSITQYCDYRLFSVLKKRYPHSSFIARSYATLLFVQLLDTLLFSFLGLYGIIHESIWSIIAVSYCIKILTLVSAGPLIGFINKYLKAKI